MRALVRRQQRTGLNISSPVDYAGVLFIVISVFISVTVSLRVNASYSPLVCMFVCSVMSVFAELNCFLWPLADLCYLWKGRGGGLLCCYFTQWVLSGLPLASFMLERCALVCYIGEEVGR